MRAHYLQHVPFEGLGSIECWLQSKSYDITSTQLFEASEFPSVEEIDFLIVMGGSMSVNDEQVYPWLTQEKAFIRNVIESGKPVLGICLGAQLIASTLGANVYQNAFKEIGWFPIHSTPISSTELFNFPTSATVFHWHGETFDLPSNASLLASSEGCKNQAFQVGSTVIGLQFHLETTPESAKAIVSNCRDELVPARYIQAENEILSAEAESFHAINNLMGEIITFLTKK